jgi:preprotein translocase subunit SecD
VDALGVKEPIVQKQGAAGDRILIQLPGVEDPQRAKEILQDPARLEWKAVIYPPGVVDYGQWIPPASEDAVRQMFGGSLPPGVELIGQRFASAEGGGTAQIYWPLSSVSVVVGNDLRSAHRGADQLGRSTVDFQLTPEAGRRFGSATREYVGKKMAIVLGNSLRREVISAPVIRDEIRDRGQISGSFDVKSAEDLALKLRSGAIPANVSIIEERTVGPSLGRDSIRAGVLASIVGFVGVAAFMFIYYRLSGVNAVVALLMNVVLLLGALGYFGATLTLPGIAGLILTVGMAVDSNILIFERIREELRAGKVVRSAIEQGFQRAFGTIIDTHATTLISAFFLFTYGTGPVRGFAVTLVIGLILSMFTAVFVSRVIYDLVLGDRKVESLSI